MRAGRQRAGDAQERTDLGKGIFLDIFSPPTFPGRAIPPYFNPAWGFGPSLKLSGAYPTAGEFFQTGRNRPLRIISATSSVTTVAQALLIWWQGTVERFRGLF